MLYSNELVADISGGTPPRVNFMTFLGMLGLTVEVYERDPSLWKWNRSARYFARLVYGHSVASVTVCGWDASDFEQILADGYTAKKAVENLAGKISGGRLRIREGCLEIQTLFETDIPVLSTRGLNVRKIVTNKKEG